MKLYHFLRGKCAHRRRGYSGEISLHHSGFCSGSYSDPHGSTSFSCGREGSITYTRRPSYSPRPSYCPPVPVSPTHSVSGGRGGYGVTTSGDYGGTSDWGVAVGTVPVYSPGWGGGYSPEGSGYGYPAPPSPPGDALTVGGVGEGAGIYGGGPGYAGGVSPAAQQKCPVAVPVVKSQQCKQKSLWPPSQKK